MSQAYKVAAVQAAPVFLDLDGTVDKALDLIEQAGAHGVKLIAFPETWIPGYPWWIWLGAPAWGMQFVGRYHRSAIETASGQDERLAEAARDNGIHVVMGVAEKAGGSLYMGQWHYGPDGKTIARRRKLKPTHVERTVFGEGDGSDLLVSDTDIGRIGALCCWEHLQPLTKYAMYSQGEQVHIASWPSFSLYNDVAYALGPELNAAASQMYTATPRLVTSRAGPTRPLPTFSVSTRTAASTAGPSSISSRTTSGIRSLRPRWPSSWSRTGRSWRWSATAPSFPWR